MSASCTTPIDHQQYQSLLQDAATLKKMYDDRLSICSVEETNRLLEEDESGILFINTGRPECSVPNRPTHHHNPETDLPPFNGKKFETCAVYCDDEECMSKTHFLLDEFNWVNENCKRVVYLPEGADGFLRHNNPVSDACRVSMRRQINPKGSS